MRIVQLIGTMVIVLAAGLVIAAPASAQQRAAWSSYITPFPEKDTYKLDVIGGSLARGLVGGLQELYAQDARLVVARKPRTFTGLTFRRADRDIAGITSANAKDRPHIIVVMVGAADRRSLAPARGRRLRPLTAAWRKAYGRRVDALIKGLKKHKAAIYWVGLPVGRRANKLEETRVINQVVREKAYLNGIKFIDIWSKFADETGRYSPYGPDLTGKIVLLRARDGLHFSWAGNLKLAHFVQREINRDLLQAQGERTLPLAGNKREQRRIRKAVVAAKAKRGGAKRKVPGGGWRGKTRRAAAKLRRSGQSGKGVAQRPDHGSIDLNVAGAGRRPKIVSIKIVRPAIPAAVIAHITRRASSKRPQQLGASVQAQIAGGLTAVSSITPSSAFGGRAGARKVPVTQTPYYRVLVKGELLTPKPGRADDFRWHSRQQARVTRER